LWSSQHERDGDAEWKDDQLRQSLPIGLSWGHGGKRRGGDDGLVCLERAFALTVAAQPLREHMHKAHVRGGGKSTDLSPASTLSHWLARVRHSWRMAVTS
jgi:hypothetical protein